MAIDYYKEIKTRYGNVKRAKGFYLYTEKNVRLLDLYLDNGMSLLGRRKNQSPLILKQFIDKGLSSCLPTKADYNLEKALNTLFPEHSDFRLYSSDGACLEALKEIDLADSSISYNSLEDRLWRPFMSDSDELLKEKAFFLRPASCSVFKILLFKKNEALNLPNSDLMPAMEKASLARAFFDLAKKQEEYKKTKNLSDDEYLRFTSTKRQRKQATKSLKQRREVESLADKFWQRKDSYLFTKLNEEEYTDFFFKALDAHVVISPNYEQPSFLPKLENYTELLNFLNTF